MKWKEFGSYHKKNGIFYCHWQGSLYWGIFLGYNLKELYNDC